MYFHILEGDLEFYIPHLNPPPHKHDTQKFWLGWSGEDDWGAWGWRKILKDQEDFRWNRENRRGLHM